MEILNYDISPKGLDSDNYDISFISGTLTVEKKTLTLSGSAIYGIEKEYDGTTDVTNLYEIDIRPQGIYNYDDVEVVAVSGSYASKNVGTDIEVTIYEVELSGNKKDNYDIDDNPAVKTTGIINPRHVKITGISVTPKVYDGGTWADVNCSSAVFDKLVDGDDIQPDYLSASYDDANVGTNKHVSLDYEEYCTGLKGDDKDNYTLDRDESVGETIGDINKAPLTVTAKNKDINYGEDAANDGVEYDGFVENEDEDDLDESLTYTYGKTDGETFTVYAPGNPVGTYEIRPSGLTSDNYDITFNPGTLTVNQVATISVTWSDNDNQDGKRPETVTAALSNGTEDVAIVTLNEGNVWTATVKDLPGYDSEDQLIDYNWSVVPMPEDYYEGGRSNVDIATTLTLSHTIEKTEVSIQAIWGDSDNTEGFRPDDITVKLLADGEQAGTVTLNEENEWKYTFTGLNKYADGEEIEYTLSQDQLANYKVPAIAKTSETGWAYSVTNSRDYEETEVKVSKVWDDNENEEGFRTASVTVHLKKGDEVIESVELKEDNSWMYTWIQLQKYENGTAINYTVTEDPVANYSTQITKATDGTFTYTVTNSRSVEKTEVSVQVVWDYKNNEMGFRPESVTVKLLVNGVEDDTKTATLNLASEWKYTWTELNKFANRQEIEYTISQDQVNGYMNPTIAKVSESDFSYTVTNKFISVSGVTLTKDASGITLTLTNTGEETVSIPTSIEVDHVVIEREFEANKAATVYLPFSFAVSKVSGGKFHTFTTVDETKDPWEVQYTEVTSGDIAANTPYIFMPDGANSGKIVVDNESKVSVSTANPQTTTQGLWEFIGTYKRIKWTHDDTDPEYDSDREAEIGSVYGFAANDRGSDHVGDFVKVGNNVWINPTRAYLKRSSSSGSRTREIAEQLPDKMKVVLISANGESMEIGTISLDYETGDWYSIDGRKLNGKPTKKGLYINNGKKVVIKN